MATTYGVYIHIPFCKSKCDYCDFYSLAGREEEMDHYQKALHRPAQVLCAPLEGPGGGHHLFRRRDSLLLWGEAPAGAADRSSSGSLPSADRRRSPWSATPTAWTWRSIARLRRAGVNRISLGAQTADPQQLRCLHRIHSTRQVVQAVADIRRAKITNLSLDLIYGLPDQDMASWLDTLNKAIALAPEHLSCYGLKVEEGTPLARQAELGLRTARWRRPGRFLSRRRGPAAAGGLPSI